jgi:hypothetical protein
VALSADDRFAIQDLYSRYNHAIDSGDGEGWAATFTPNGMFESALGVETGRAALAAFANKLGQQYRMRHWINNLLVEETPGGATGRCYLLGYVLGGEQPAVGSVAIYHDEMEKTADGWRFAKRILHYD